jgi:heme/copper-type cytochrome/quinol oxidase subunit 2
MKAPIRILSEQDYQKWYAGKAASAVSQSGSAVPAIAAH